MYTLYLMWKLYIFFLFLSNEKAEKKMAYSFFIKLMDSVLKANIITVRSGLIDLEGML